MVSIFIIFWVEIANEITFVPKDAMHAMTNEDLKMNMKSAKP